jgi:hypothetical protein
MPTDPPSTIPSSSDPQTQQSRDHLADVMESQGLSKDGAETLAAMMASPTETSNPFFGANPMVAYMEVFAELTRTMQKVREVEQRQHVASMQVIMSVAKDQAKLLREKAETEARMHLVQATASAVACTIGIGVAGQLGAAMRHKPEQDGKQISIDTQMASVMMTQAAMGRGISTAVINVVEGMASEEQGRLDAEKAVTESMVAALRKTQESVERAHAQTAKDIDSLLSTMNGLIEQVNAANQLSRH